MMRADLHWSYFLAGAMNTGNAVGYLIGALTMSWLIKRFTAARVFVVGGGLGIMIPSFFVPALTDLGQQWQWFYAWQLAWFGLAAIGFLGLACMWFPGHSIPPVPPRENASDSTSVRRYARMVSGYVLFGVGYIGYMTFVIALLMQIGMVGMRLNIFFALLGLSAIASSKI
jgi:MFS family permease